MWFGEPWPSYICYDEDWRLQDERRIPTPVGQPCILCEEAIQEGDQGEQFINGPFAHKECLFMNVTGSLAHQEKRCKCYGGDSNTSGMTRREEAIAVWNNHNNKGSA